MSCILPIRAVVPEMLILFSDMAPSRCQFSSCKWSILRGSSARKIRHLGSGCDKINSGNSVPFMIQAFKLFLTG